MGRWSRYDDQRPLTLFVANFDIDVEEEDLEKLFEEFGEVLGAQIWQDFETGRSKGWGFVTMALNEDGERAIKYLDGAVWRKRRLKVKKARNQDN